MTNSNIVIRQYAHILDDMFVDMRDYLVKVVYSSLEENEREALARKMFRFKKSDPLASIEIVHPSRKDSNSLEQAKKEKNYSLFNKQVDELVNDYLQKLSAEEKTEFLEEVITKCVDVSGATKLFTHANSFSLALQTALKQKFNYNERMNSLLIRARNYRNKYKGHDNFKVYDELSLEDISTVINVIYQAAESFKVPSLKSNLDYFTNRKDKRLIMLNNPILTINELRGAIDNFNEEILLENFNEYYDKETHTLYFTSLEEVKKRFSFIKEAEKFGRESERQKNYDQNQVILNEMNNITSGLNRLTNILNNTGGNNLNNLSNAVKDFEVQLEKKTRKKIHEPLKTFKKYKMGELQPENVLELAEKCTFIIDISAWLNPDSRDFIQKFLIPRLFKKNKVLYVDYATRVEMYQMERNENGQYSEEEMKQAHRAHVMMHLLHDRKYLYYAPQDNTYASSRENIIEMVEKNYDRRFCVVTQNRDFTEELLENTGVHCLPLSTIPCPTKDKLMVRAMCKNRVADFTKAIYEKYDGEVEEEPFEEDEEIVEEVVEKTSFHFEEKEDVVEIETVEEPKEFIVEETVEIPYIETVAEDKEDEGSVDESIVEEIVKTITTKETPKKTNKEFKKNFLNQKFECKVETGKLLPLSKEVKENDILYTKDKNTVTVLSEIARGGEGIVYNVNDSKQVAKIYYPNTLTENRFEKLQLMVSNNPHMDNLCWPDQLLFNKEGQFVGYTMPKVNKRYVEIGSTVFKLKNPRVRTDENLGMNTWDRLSLARLCSNLNKFFTDIHKLGFIMGDVNPKNILVDPKSHENPRFIVVDCDSFQIGGYPCPVGTIAFTSPEIYTRLNTDSPHFSEFLRTRDDELYSVATLLFKVLMFGQSPFAGKGETDFAVALRNYNFSYRSEGNSGVDTPDGHYRLIWNNTPKYVKDYFAKVFTGNGVVSGREWDYAFGRYIREIKLNQYTKDLFPNRYWDNAEREFTVDIVCEGCGTETNTPKRRYETNKKFSIPNLCNNCYSSFLKLKDVKQSIVCTECKETKEISEYNLIILENSNKKYICSDCDKGVDIVCEGCKQTYRTKNFLVKQGIAHYCSDCRKNVKFSCPTCKKEIIKPRHIYNKIMAKGGKYHCDECMEQLSVQCTECHKLIKKPRYLIQMLTRSKKDIHCDDCAATIQVNCSTCNQIFEVPRFVYQNSMKRNGRYNCPSCLENVNAVCGQCGRTFQTKRFRIIQNRQLGRINKCPNCLPPKKY